MMKDDGSTPFLADLAASQKFITGEWFVIPHEGKIYNKFHDEIKGALSHGYSVIGTKYYGEKVNVMFHRAIWIGAHGGIIPDPELQIDHISGNKQDNRIQNLRLVTPKENSNNPNAPCAKWGLDNPSAKLSPEQKQALYQEWKEGQALLKGHGRPTTRKLSSKYGVCQQRVSEIIREMKSAEEAHT